MIVIIVTTIIIIIIIYLFIYIFLISNFSRCCGWLRFAAQPKFLFLLWASRRLFCHNNNNNNNDNNCIINKYNNINIKSNSHVVRYMYVSSTLSVTRLYILRSTM